MSSEKKDDKNLTLQDLENAVKTINRFTDLYIKSTGAIKKHERATGAGKSMRGMGGDPITSMLMGSIDNIMEKKMGEIADKRLGTMGIGDADGAVAEDDLKEAEAGLKGDGEEEEEEEEEG